MESMKLAEALVTNRMNMNVKMEVKWGEEER